MTNKKINREYIILVIVGFTLWVLETAYFGWNEKPINEIEKILDVVSWVLIIWGILGDIASKITYKNEIHTNKVYIQTTRKINYDKQKPKQ